MQTIPCHDSLNWDLIQQTPNTRIISQVIYGKKKTVNIFVKPVQPVRPCLVRPFG